jgi:hypothetical protein
MLGGSLPFDDREIEEVIDKKLFLKNRFIKEIYGKKFRMKLKILLINYLLKI